MTSQTPLQKIKKSVKPSSKDGAKKPAQKGSRRFFRGPLFWIIVAIFAVTLLIDIPKLRLHKRLMRSQRRKLIQQYLLINLKRFAWFLAMATP